MLTCKHTRTLKFIFACSISECISTISYECIPSHFSITFPAVSETTTIVFHLATILLCDVVGIVFLSIVLHLLMENVVVAPVAAVVLTVVAGVLCHVSYLAFSTTALN